MLRFFRKMRKALIPENRFGRYFFYAVGEIVLVVIGILIALQVNNWNENRKNRIYEKRILNELIVSLSRDLSTLEYNFELHKQAIKSSEIVLNALTENEQFNDSLAFHFAAVYYYTRFDCYRGAYESL